MIEIIHIFGKTGVVIFIAVIIFIYVYANSTKLFDWIEDQILGNKEYILEKISLLFLDIEPHKITYLLLFLSFGLSTIVMAFFMLFSFWKLGIFLSIVIGVLGWKIPRPFVDYLCRRRIKLYQGQMVDALNLLGNGLKAGLSFNQGLRMIVDEMDPPISQEFKRVLDENNLGQPLEECLDNLAKKINIPENDMFVNSVNILKESGGNLPDIFDTITHVIRERIRLQQRIDVYTAMGRMQSTVVMFMPTAILLMMAATNKQSVLDCFTNPVGLVLIIGGYMLNIAGFLVIRRMVRIDI